MNILKSFHKEYMKHNQIAIHKMIISENIVELNATDDKKNFENQPKTQNPETVKFDLRMPNKDAERDFFKICVISQIFN